MNIPNDTVCLLVLNLLTLTYTLLKKIDIGHNFQIQNWPLLVVKHPPKLFLLKADNMVENLYICVLSMA